MTDVAVLVRPSGVDESWFGVAACRGTDINEFFPDSGVRPMRAMALCWNCPVRLDCLEWAIENHVHWGVWGGLTERERFREKRRRRLPSLPRSA